MDRRPVDVARRRAPALFALLGFAAVLGVAVLGAAGRLRAISPRPAAALAEAPTVTPTPPTAPPERFDVQTLRLSRNQTVAQALGRLDVAAAEARAVLAAMNGIFPFRKARAGDQLLVERREADGALHRFAYRQGPADEWIVERLPDGTLRGSKRPVELTTELTRVAVTIDGSLSESLQGTGEDPGLAVLAADALAWDVDFYRDVRRGDRMKILVEKIFADGKLLRYGEVLAAEYDGSATGRKRIFRYTDPSGQASYYDEDGNSARRGFLKSPLRYAQITSRFGNRNHPLLGYMQAHQGVDYGAPIGTPVWAVGEGVVKQSGWNGGCGISVTIHHRNGFDTLYCHLSATAVSAGKPAAQKQVIGYVGSTGLSTGPHLHYAVKRGGGFINPLQLKLPRDVPVPAKWKPDFLEKTAPLRARISEPVA